MSAVVPHVTLWDKCLSRLEEELSPQQFNTWIRPLQPVQEGDALKLLAPNRFVMEWVRDRFIQRIGELVSEQSDARATKVTIEVGSQIRRLTDVGAVVASRAGD